MATLAVIVNLVNLIMVDPVITLYWQEEFGLSEGFAGQMYAITYAGLSATQFFNPFIYRFFHPRLLIFLSLFFESSLVFLLYGPSRLIGMPNRWQLAVAGMIAGKFANGFGYLAIMPEIVESCRDAFSLP